MLTIIVLLSCIGAISTESETVLVLGGQGLAGSATISALLESGFPVAALNDNNEYYDYHELFQDKIEMIACIRPSGLEGCFELQNFLKTNTKLKAVVDFTSSKKTFMEDAVEVLKPLNPDVWVFVSAAAVYDVSVDPKQPIKESDAVRPEDPFTSETYGEQNTFGNNMLSSEEVLIESGIPYVIFRCGDVVGPRDTTFRWWQYQVWTEHFDLIGAGFPVPSDYEHLPFSMTYGDDVGKAIVSALNKGVTNEIYNIAMDKTFTLPHYLLELCKYFGNGEACWADYTATQESYSLYPSNHMGTLDLSHAQADLDFVPTPWEEVLESTMTFYEQARHLHAKERDEVLNRLNQNIVPYLRVESLNGAVLNAEQKVMESVNKPEVNRVEL